MASPEKKFGSSDEVENGDVQATAGDHAKGTVEYERAQLLACLPDPDAGKSDEERAAIVSEPTVRNTLIPIHDH